MSKVIGFFAILMLSWQVSAKGPCFQDREKFCAGIEKGEGRIMKCLKENESSLSAECKSHREKMKQARKEVKAACEDDVESLCSNVEPGQGRIMRCMKENQEKLSAGCQAEINEKKELRKNSKMKEKAG
jgi:hypothetical protein